LIFQKQIAGKVARGEATLTIRPATSRPPAHGARRCVKVQQRGAIACHITITDVQDMLAGEVTFKQARACGYRTTDEFKAAWVRERDAKWVEFYGDAAERTDDELVARFNVKHAFASCYAITFKLATDTPRFLAAPGRGEIDSHGNADYTRQRHRAIDDLEVVDELTAERYSKKAREQRESFKRDLEKERQRYRNARRDRLFNAA
jgi:hypothetical protein